jgi:uncharacterized membrane protein
MPAVDVTSDIIIKRPADVVAAYAADPSNAPAWYVNIRSAEWRIGPPLRPGAEIRFTATFLGRRLTYTYRVAEFTPGERLVMRSSEGPFPMETTYGWQPAGNGSTRMTLRNRGGPGGLLAVVAPVMAAAVRRATRKDLARLKSILERG